MINRKTNHLTHHTRPPHSTTSQTQLNKKNVGNQKEYSPSPITNHRPCTAHFEHTHPTHSVSGCSPFHRYPRILSDACRHQPHSSHYARFPHSAPSPHSSSVATLATRFHLTHHTCSLVSQLHSPPPLTPLTSPAHSTHLPRSLHSLTGGPAGAVQCHTHRMKPAIYIHHTTCH
eukprot:GHVN01105002.1.p2 GENE.GHVN01105002.1~~GHVN01105002.1.p2  ORF type:complete len:174 (-),score=66.55 GHVN01105002.1:567-1088(-)